MAAAHTRPIGARPLVRRGSSRRVALVVVAGLAAMLATLPPTAVSIPSQDSTVAVTSEIPEVLRGDTWLRHHREDLMPYWDRPEALGEPLGNFPSFRGRDGELLPETPREHGPRPLDVGQAGLRLLPRVHDDRRGPLPDLREGGARLDQHQGQGPGVRRLLRQAHNRRGPRRSVRRQERLRPGLAWSGLRHVLQRDPGSGRGGRSAGRARPDLRQVLRRGGEPGEGRPDLRPGHGGRHERQRRRHHEPAGARNGRAAPEPGDLDRPRPQGTVHERPAAGDRQPDRPAQEHLSRQPGPALLVLGPHARVRRLRRPPDRLRAQHQELRDDPQREQPVRGPPMAEPGR